MLTVAALAATIGLATQDPRGPIPLSPDAPLEFELEIAPAALLDTRDLGGLGPDTFVYAQRVVIAPPVAARTARITTPLGTVGTGRAGGVLRAWVAADRSGLYSLKDQGVHARGGSLSLPRPGEGEITLVVACTREFARERRLDPGFRIPVRIELLSEEIGQVPQESLVQALDAQRERVTRLRAWKPAVPVLLSDALFSLAERLSPADASDDAYQAAYESHELLNQHASGALMDRHYSAMSLASRARAANRLEIACERFEEAIRLCRMGADEGGGAGWIAFHEWSALVGLTDALVAAKRTREALDAVTKLERIATDHPSVGPETQSGKWVHIVGQLVELGEKERARALLPRCRAAGSSSYQLYDDRPRDVPAIQVARLLLTCEAHGELEDFLDELGAQTTPAVLAKSKQAGPSIAAFVKDAAGSMRGPALCEYGVLAQRAFLENAAGKISPALARLSLDVAREALRWDRAVDALRLCADAASGFPAGSAEAAETHLWWGVAALAEGRSDDAIREIDLALGGRDHLADRGLLDLGLAVAALAQASDTAGWEPDAVLADLKSSARTDSRIRSLVAGWPEFLLKRGHVDAAERTLRWLDQNEWPRTTRDRQRGELVRACIALERGPGAAPSSPPSASPAQTGVADEAHKGESAYLTGIAQARGGDWDAATRSFSTAVACAVAMPIDERSLLGARELRQRLARVKQYGDAYLACLARRADRRLDLAELDPLIQLQDIAGRLATRGRSAWSGEGATDGLYARWVTMRDGWGGAGGEAAEQEARSAERLRIERELAQRVAAGLPSLEKSGSLKNLPAGTVLLVLRRVDSASWDARRWWPYSVAEGEVAPRYLAIGVKRGAEIGAVVDLGDARAVDAAVGAYLADTLQVQDGRGIAGVEAGASASATDVEAVWSGIRSVIADAKRVLVIAEGVFDGFPIGALPTGRQRYAIEQAEFVLLDGGWQLAELGTPFPKSLSSALLVGGVDFSGYGVASAAGRTRAAIESAGGAFAALPGTLAEVEAIEATFRTKSKQVGAVRRLSGAEASESAVRGAWKDAAWVHVATHGYYLGNAPADGASTVGEVPGVLAGLVLACEGPERSGLLTADEIAAADGSGWELVVLSACHSARGRAISGEGLASVRRAFHLAGANRVVSAAWAVPDQDTSELMRRFYDEILRGTAPSAALRTTQIALLKEYRKSRGPDGAPAAWAGFYLSGRYR